MLVEIIGVLDDGARPMNASMPADPRWALTIQQSCDVTVRVTLKNWGGAPVLFTGSDHLVLTARTIPSPSTRKLFAKSSTHPASTPANVHDILIAAADTRALQITRAIYDIYAVRTSGKPVVIPTSYLIISRAVADVASLV